jgi:hypothetical protein
MGEVPSTNGDHSKNARAELSNQNPRPFIFENAPTLRLYVAYTEIFLGFGIRSELGFQIEPAMKHKDYYFRVWRSLSLLPFDSYRHEFARAA